LTALHQSQIKAYRAAATAALTEWADTVVLPEINTNETTMTLEQYIQHCRTVTTASRPAWRDGTSQRKSEMARIEERAKDAYAAHMKKENAAVAEEGEEEEEEGEVEDMEENAANVTPTPNTAEDEEDDGEIDETTNVIAETKTETKSNNNKVVKPSPQRNNKPSFVKKTTITKPKVNPPPSARSVRGGRSGRGSSVRGGRGGSSRP
jgi:hypothetical protein